MSDTRRAKVEFREAWKQAERERKQAEAVVFPIATTGDVLNLMADSQFVAQLILDADGAIPVIGDKE